MNSATKVMLAAFAIPAVLAAAAPQRETAARPAFETATIKLSTGPSRANVITQPSPNRLSIPGMTLMALVYAAYGDGGFNTSMSVRGVKPDWANQTVYAIEGLAARPAMATAFPNIWPPPMTGSSSRSRSRHRRGLPTSRRSLPSTASM